MAARSVNTRTVSMKHQTPRRSRSLVFVPEHEMDILFGSAHPNPSRADCPSDALLAALSRRERPIEDPGYDHLGKCSHCYRELRALQQTASRGRRNPFARFTWLLRQLGWRR